MNKIFFTLAIIAMIAVLITLVAGVVLMASGSKSNKKYAQRLMRARVYLQAIALFFVVLAFTLK
jgi:hypothetical protein